MTVRNAKSAVIHIFTDIKSAIFAALTDGLRALGHFQQQTAPCTTVFRGSAARYSVADRWWLLSSV